MYRSALALGALAVCLTLPLRAQDTVKTRAPGSPDILLLDHDFSTLGEYARVFLQAGQVYRAELSSPDALLQIRAVFDGVVRPAQLPRIYRFLASETPSGTSIFEIYPEVDTEYEIRSVALAGTIMATRLRLYRDVGASARRQQVRETRGWDLGVELAGGWHSGYRQSSAPPSTGSAPAGGSDIEICFSARAPRGSRFGLCALGLSHQSQPGAKNVLWLYTEPRLRLLGGGRPDRSSWDLGALVRFGLGHISAASVTPITIAPGIYLARHLRNARGQGWSFQGSYARHVYRGFDKPAGVAGTVHPTSNRLSLGLGWYH